MRVLPSPCYVFSDTHLGAASSEVERQLLAFLRHLPGRARSLVINGDLFEFWFEWRSVIPRPSFRVLAALADLVESGVPVLWVAGNHDCWGGDVLRERCGRRLSRRRRGAAELAGWQNAHRARRRAARRRGSKVPAASNGAAPSRIDLGISASAASGFRQSTRGGIVAREPHVSGARWRTRTARGRDGAARGECRRSISSSTDTRTSRRSSERRTAAFTPTPARG